MKLYLNLTEKYSKSIMTVSITCHAIFMNISFIVEAAERYFIHHRDFPDELVFEVNFVSKVYW